MDKNAQLRVPKPVLHLSLIHIFHSVETEAAVLKDETESAVLTLNAEDGSAWKYYQTWTIGKWNGTVFETLNYEETAFDGKTLDLTLEPGCYRLITSIDVYKRQVVFFSNRSVQHHRKHGYADHCQYDI